MTQMTKKQIGSRLNNVVELCALKRLRKLSAPMRQFKSCFVNEIG